MIRPGFRQKSQFWIFFTTALGLVSFISQSSFGSLGGDSEPACSPDTSTANPQRAAQCNNSDFAQNSCNLAGTQKDPEGQIGSFCETALDSAIAADAYQMLYRVWMGVSVICGASCIATSACAAGAAPACTAVPALSSSCTATNIGAGVIEMLKASELGQEMLQSMMMTMTTLGMTVMAGGAFDGFSQLATQLGGGAAPMSARDLPSGATDAAKEDAIGGGDAARACLPFIMSLFQMYMKKLSGDQSAESAEACYEAACLLGSPTPVLDPTLSQDQATTTAGADRSGTKTESPGDGDQPPAVPSTPPECVSCPSGETPAGMICCAAAKDSDLPGWVPTEKFPSDFNKISGQPLGQFLQSGAPPSQSVPGALGGLLGAEGAAALSSAMSEMERKMQLLGPLNQSGATYSGGGGGGHGKGGGGGDDGLADLMAGLMGGLAGGEKGQEKKNLGVSELDFTLSHRNPTQIVEDRTISLFTRVSFRYRKNHTQIQYLPWSLPENK